MPEAARHAMGLLPTSVAQSNPAPGNGGAGQTTGLGSSLHRAGWESAAAPLYSIYGLHTPFAGPGCLGFFFSSTSALASALARSL